MTVLTRIFSAMRRKPAPRRPLAPQLIPTQLTMPPVALRDEAALRSDSRGRTIAAGQEFIPNRTDARRFVLPVGRVVLSIPDTIEVEVAFELENGDWTPWLKVKGPQVRSHVAAVGGRWRIVTGTVR